MKTKLAQVIQIARQFQIEYEKSQKKNAKLKSKLDLKQLELSKTNLVKSQDPKSPDLRQNEFDRMLQIHENKIYELETDVQDRDRRIRDLERDVVELKNKNSKL